MQTVSFKEVHAELELENDFLNKRHDYASYKEKASFLESCGFKNSIATKLYSALSGSAGLVREYSRKYNQHKFILDPQLERLCEKYNLYVRDSKFFMGDIP